MTRPVGDVGILVVGAGGLGSPAALAFAGSGVGRIGVIDPDLVDLSNLNRQVLHRTVDVGRPKAASAARRLRALAPGLTVEAVEGRLDPTNAMDLVRRYDAVLDGSDNFATKFLVNDACVLAGVPFVIGGVLRFEGQVMAVRPGVSACYRCLFDGSPPAGLVPTCREAGVLGAVVGLIGALQAAEALKLATGDPGAATGRLLVYDALRASFRAIEVDRQPDCLACGEAAAIDLGAMGGEGTCRA